jgi:capsular polysaccharide export protein
MAENCVAVLLPALHLWREQRLATLLGLPLVASPLRPRGMRVIAYAGWGMKPSGRFAAWRAARTGLPCWRLEDGFLRSVEPGLDHAPLSIVVDDMGIYYDAARPSALEAHAVKALPAEAAARAGEIVAAWRAARVSKYNHLPEYGGALPARYVLVADQTFGDASIRYGMAGPDSFTRMLQAALAENPDATILVKIHPDVFAGRKRGYFDVPALSSMARVKVLAEDVHPVGLIEGAAAVYVVTSQIGFEGLLWGKRVRAFGMPFYGGWGLTNDELPAPARRRPVPLENIVHAALVDYPRYLDPETGRRCEVERLMEWMGAQRRLRDNRTGGGRGAMTAGTT